MASPYRADHVGRLLRPPDLLQARSDHAEGKIADERLREVVEASILAALGLERLEQQAFNRVVLVFLAVLGGWLVLRSL